MRARCDRCSAGYTLPASKLRPGRRVQFSCRRCGHRVVVAVPGASGAVAPSEPALRRTSLSHAPRGAGSRPSPIGRGEGDGAVIGPHGSQGAARSRLQARGDLLGALDTGGRQGTGAGSGNLSYREAVAKKALRRTAAPPETQVRWFVAGDDGSYRKLATDDVRAGIDSGEIHGQTLLWRKGWPEWRAAIDAPQWREEIESAARRREADRDETEVDRPAMAPQDPATGGPGDAERAGTRESDGPADERAEGGDERGGDERGGDEREEDERGGDEREEDEGARAPDPGPAHGMDADARAGDPGQADEARPEDVQDPRRVPDDQDAGAPAERDPEGAGRDGEGARRAGHVEATATAVAHAEAPAEGSPRVVVSGVGRRPTGQRAVSLPIVRAKGGEERPAPKRRRPRPLRSRRGTSGDASKTSPGAASGRFAAGRGSHGTPMDSGRQDPGGESPWAPATDTYIGPRDRFTHRLGSEDQRAELLAQVDREQRLLRQVRSWQWIALGCATAAIVAFALTVYAMINLRMVQGEVQTLQSRVERLQSGKR